jgi:hypothetical protein
MLDQSERKRRGRMVNFKDFLQIRGCVHRLHSLDLYLLNRIILMGIFITCNR